MQGNNQPTIYYMHITYFESEPLIEHDVVRLKKKGPKKSGIAGNTRENVVVSQILEKKTQKKLAGPSSPTWLTFFFLRSCTFVSL
jgi:hypothetical protein